MSTFNPCTQEAEAGKSQKFKASLVYRVFQDSQGYAEKACLDKIKQNTQTQITPPPPPNYDFH